MVDRVRHLARHHALEQAALALGSRLEHGIAAVREGEAKLLVGARERGAFVLQREGHARGDVGGIDGSCHGLAMVPADEEEEPVERGRQGEGCRPEERAGRDVGVELAGQKRCEAPPAPPTRDGRCATQRGEPGSVATPDPGPQIGELAQVPVPQAQWLGDPVHRPPVGLHVHPLVADEARTMRDEGQDGLGLAALRPAADHDPAALVEEGRRVQGKRAAREDREVQGGDEQWDRRHSALADDLAATPDPVERDQHARPRLVAAAQDQEGILGEAGVVEAEQPQRPVKLEAIDETHEDVGLASQRPPDRTELAVDRGDVAWRRADHADAGEPVQVVVDGRVIHAHADRNARGREGGK
jgi:hypothetical protein